MTRIFFDDVVMDVGVLEYLNLVVLEKLGCVGLRAQSNCLVLSLQTYFSRYERSIGPVLAFAY